MAELLTAAQMRAIEQAAIDSGEVTGLELMERAGKGVVEAIFEEWPELAQTSHRAVVLCGPGNNGGDGFVIARLLKEWGWEVEVFLYGDAERLPPDARVNYERWVEMRAVVPLSSHTVFAPEKTDLIVDALFGSGLSRPLFDLVGLRTEIEACATRFRIGLESPRVVSVDIPSGMDSDSGIFIGYSFPATERPEEECIHANLTVTFEKPFLGHFLGYGPRACGVLVTKSIGLEGTSIAWNCAALVGVESRIGVLNKAFHMEALKRATHKFSHGHALILSGGSGKGGAGRLAARGALRIGAGLVTVGPTPGALQENAARLDAVMLSPVKDADTLGVVLQDGRINALCLGPGLGIERARELVPGALEAKRATVLDADALSAYTDDPLFLFDMLHKGCVLTPHAGEFARLFPDLAQKLNAEPTKGPAYSKVDATREAAARAGCVVLFKGADTVIAAPDGRCSVNSAAYERAAPWLATAGSGDVLAGFITGLLARGLSPMQAAESGAWLHVECALEFGPGLVAEDLPEQLPKVFRKLGL